MDGNTRKMKKTLIHNENDEFFMETAFRLSKKSHCVSKKVGAVLVKDHRIISMGYNGSFPGWKNCDEIFDSTCYDSHKHHEWSNFNEIHAEMNCLLFAAKNGIETDGCTLYTTLSPCQHCLKNSIQAGISRIVYLIKYDRIPMDAAVLEYIKKTGIIIEQLDGANLFYTKEQCILEFENTKNITYNTHLKDSIWYHTSWINNENINSSEEYEQRIFHIKNKLEHIPVDENTNLKIFKNGKYSNHINT